MSKSNYTQTHTPRGTFIYPWLNTPDTKYQKAHGAYKTSFAVDPGIEVKDGDMSFEDFVALCEKTLEEYIEANPKDLKPAVIKKAGRHPFYEEELDDEGEETGRYLFKFKLKARVELESGKAWKQKPVLVDATPKKLTEQVWSGSVGYCNVELFPYYMATSKEFGISFRLKGAQIVDLVTGSGDESGGFGAKDGFSSSGVEADVPENDFDDDVDDDVEEDEEF